MDFCRVRKLYRRGQEPSRAVQVSAMKACFRSSIYSIRAGPSNYSRLFVFVLLTRWGGVSSVCKGRDALVSRVSGKTGRGYCTVASPTNLGCVEVSA